MESLKLWLIKHFSDICIACIAVLAPEVPVLITVGILIIFDLLTGVAAAIKRKEYITSRKLSLTISKAIFYGIAYFTSMAIQYLTTFPFKLLMAGFIGIVEAKSILENISYILGIDFWIVIKNYIIRNQQSTKDLIDGIGKKDGE